MKVIIVYDDTGRKSEIITDIIGDKGFADVVVKKRKLEEYYRDELEKLYPGLTWKKIHSVFEYAELVKSMELYGDTDARILHCFSNYLIADSERVLLAYKKLIYIDEPFAVMEGKRAVAAMFPDVASYTAFCKNIISGQKAWDSAKNLQESFKLEGVVDISVIGNFIQCITGNFDSRYFNSLKGDEYTLVKRSANKKKIRSEYTFYQLLPEDMKFWFVMPFHYTEDGGSASYTMERLHMADLAIKWVHGSMDESEFDALMDKYFFFFKSRHCRACSAEVYQKTAKALYMDKVIDRIRDLKNFPEYQKISALLEASGSMDIDTLAAEYFRLKEDIEARVNYPMQEVIGHGDPCFANALYNKSTRTLKFIDPRGALREDDLWTNPYYDIAKLSHSVCGKYDFFNNGLYDIRIGGNGFSCELEIPFDNTGYVEIFKRKVEEQGFDYLSVRIYEVSLFLSMLPLHMDNPHKVLGFILNAQNILEEIEKNV